MLEAIIGGEQDATQLADLAKGRLRSKHADLVRALESTVRDHHRFLLAQHLAQIDFLEEQIATFDSDDRGTDQTSCHGRSATARRASAGDMRIHTDVGGPSCCSSNLGRLG
jgi:hypothetical protein